jgi:hypothetical protein
MRDPREVLTAKLQQYKQLLKEIDSLRIVIPMLAEPEPNAPKESTHES